MRQLPPHSLIRPLLLLCFVFFIACGSEVEGEREGENGGDVGVDDDVSEDCPLEHESFCLGSGCCPEGCYSLEGWTVNLGEECLYGADDAHWCMPPSLLPEGEAAMNVGATDCFYDDDSDTGHVTPSMAGAIDTSEGPLVRCDGQTQMDVHDLAEAEECEVSQ